MEDDEGRGRAEAEVDEVERELQRRLAGIGERDGRAEEHRQDIVVRRQEEQAEDRRKLAEREAVLLTPEVDVDDLHLGEAEADGDQRPRDAEGQGAGHRPGLQEDEIEDHREERQGGAERPDASRRSQRDERQAEPKARDEWQREPEARGERQPERQPVRQPEPETPGARRGLGFVFDARSDHDGTVRLAHACLHVTPAPELYAAGGDLRGSPRYQWDAGRIARLRVGEPPRARDGRLLAYAGAGLRRIAAAITTATPIPIRTSPTLNTFASGSQAGSAKRSVSGSSAGCSTTTLFVLPPTPIPSDASADGLAGIAPPFAAIAARFRPDPRTINGTPVRRRLARTTIATADVDAR